TDAFVSGDRFDVFDFGASLGQTSVPTAGIDCGDDPVPCLANPNVSHRSYLLGSGNHSITLTPTVAPSGGGAGYLNAQAVPEPAASALLGSGLAVSWLCTLLRNRRRATRRQK